MPTSRPPRGCELGGSASYFARTFGSLAALWNARRQAHQQKGPANRAFQCTEMPSNSRSSGCGRQQLPVLAHDHRIDDVDAAIRRSDIRLFDVGSIDLHARGRHNRCHAPEYHNPLAYPHLARGDRQWRRYLVGAIQRVILTIEDTVRAFSDDQRSAGECSLCQFPSVSALT
jgi:hypothetical protein